MVNYISWGNCTNKKPFSYFFNYYVRFWAPPPKRILDLTHALGYNSSGLLNTTLDGDRYQFINHDLDPKMAPHVIGDLRYPAFKKQCCDILYVDPPYCDTAGRQSLNSKRKLGKTGYIFQYAKGLKTLGSLLDHIPGVANYLLKPEGDLIIKMQSRQFLPHIIPTPFLLPELFKEYFVLHDYIIYTYQSRRPTLPVFVKAKRVKLSHGYLMNFKKRID